MRHFCLTSTITALACGMIDATRSTQLMALTSLLQGLHSCQPGAVTGTVALSTVTVTADQYCCAAAGA